MGKSEWSTLRTLLTQVITLSSLSLSILFTGAASHSKLLKPVSSSFSTDLPWQSVRQLPASNTQTINQAFKFSLHLDKDSNHLIGSITITPTQGFTNTKVVTSLITAFLEQKKGLRKEIRVNSIDAADNKPILIFFPEPIKPGSDLILYLPIETTSITVEDYTMKIEAFPTGPNHLQPLEGSAIIHIQAENK